jgi:hypothetical protein
MTSTQLFPGGQPQPGQPQAGAQKTQLLGVPGVSDSPKTQLASPVGGAAPGAAATASAPVVGWIVVIDGPGKGKAVQLTYGQNIVGRGPTAHVRLDFGDDQLSSEDHFRVVYDGENRKFHLMPGSSRNLVHIGGDPLLSPTEVSGRTEIKAGRSKLLLMPLCGPDFDWSDSVSAT